ncbi:MAG: hypothetical protein ABIP34_17270 [Rhodoferax sp.]|uniref:hypothetical protein n=1 Tax=Rhodoferax sp. TaxID=50421 RepID=UPI003267AF7D
MKFNLIKLATTISIIGLISGCAGVSPNDLKIITNGAHIELSQDTNYEAYYKVTGIKWKYTVKAGKYIATRQDSLGIFYEGPFECLNSTVVNAGWAGSDAWVGLLRTIDCGVYVPFDALQTPKVFFILGSNSWSLGDKSRRREAILSITTVSPQTTDRTEPISQNTAIQTVPTASPAVIGLGSGLGAGIAGALADAEQGNYVVHRDQPDADDFRSALHFSMQ